MKLKYFEDLTNKELKKYKRIREKRLYKLGIKVTNKKNKMKGEEIWTLDKTNYKRKVGLFRSQFIPVSYN